MTLPWDMTYFFTCFVAGVFLGLAYFWGLWLTTKAAPRSRRPGVLLLLSFIGRVVVLVAAMYALTRGEPVGVSLMLLGLLLGRRVMTWWVRKVTSPEEAGETG